MPQKTFMIILGCQIYLHFKQKIFNKRQCTPLTDGCSWGHGDLFPLLDGPTISPGKNIVYELKGWTYKRP